jgi:DNA-binding NarL/FixJ family response regulator
VTEQNQQEERKTLRLLIVDDNASARSGMQALLETVTSHERELEIFEAASGQEALPLIETILPDVILMDAQMPLMNGIQATRIIKERWPTIKVVMLTMYAAYQSDALAAGVDVFLLKGCPAEELFAAIFS